MNRSATRIAIALMSVVLLGIVAWGQVKPIPKPVSPPSPNPAPVAPGSDRQSVPPIGDVPLPGGAPEAALAPFVDGQTIGAIRIDVKDFDLKAIRHWVVQGVADLRKNEKEVGRAQGDVGEQFDKVSNDLEKVRKAGVNQVYWVFSLDDMMADHPPFAVVPLAEGQDPAPIEAAIKSLTGSEKLSSAVMGRTLLFGEPETLDRLKAAKPAPRIELARAFDAAGNGQIRIALIPQEASRKAFEGISADLPKELGGGPIQTVSRGLSWMSISVAFPPNPSLRVLIQSPDPQSAAKLNEVITHAIDWARDRKEGPPEELALTGMLAGLKPKLETDRITVNLSAADTGKLAALLAGAIIQSRNATKSVEVAVHLRNFATAILAYANDHDGKFPKDLGTELDKYLGPNSKALWIDPLRPDEKKPYVYLKLGDKLSDVKEPSSAVMIYENHTTWDNGINVAFADGHVEWVTDEKQFKAMLDQTKKNNPATAEMPQ